MIINRHSVIDYGPVQPAGIQRPEKLDNNQQRDQEHFLSLYGSEEQENTKTVNPKEEKHKEARTPQKYSVSKNVVAKAIMKALDHCYPQPLTWQTEIINHASTYLLGSAEHYEPLKIQVTITNTALKNCVLSIESHNNSISASFKAATKAQYHFIERLVPSIHNYLQRLFPTENISLAVEQESH